MVTVCYVMSCYHVGHWRSHAVPHAVGPACCFVSTVGSLAYAEAFKEGLLDFNI